MKTRRYLSYLNAISCIAVLYLHSNTVFWRFSYDRYWLTSNIIETLFYFAVPVFFMISGATLMNYRKRYSTPEFMKKRIKKVFNPYIAMSVIALIYFHFFKKTFFETNDFKAILEKILNGNIISYYWYFIPQFFVYLTFPVYTVIPEENRDKIFKYMILCSFILTSVMPTLFSLIDINLSGFYSMPVAYSYSMFVLLGYVLDTNDINAKTRKLLYYLGVISFSIHLFGTQILSYELGAVDRTFKGYLNFPSVFQAVSLFTLVKYNYHKIDKWIGRIVDVICKYSFSIYLLHYFVIDFTLQYTNLNEYSILFRILFPFLIIVVLIPIIYTLRKLPLINKILT